MYLCDHEVGGQAEARVGQEADADQHQAQQVHHRQGLRRLAHEDLQCEGDVGHWQGQRLRDDQQHGAAPLGDGQHEDVVEEVHHDVGHQQPGGAAAVPLRVVGVRAQEARPAVAQLARHLSIRQPTCSTHTVHSNTVSLQYRNYYIHYYI